MRTEFETVGMIHQLTKEIATLQSEIATISATRSRKCIWDVHMLDKKICSRYHAIKVLEWMVSTSGEFPVRDAFTISKD
jgi:hypothetical protein